MIRQIGIITIIILSSLSIASQSKNSDRVTASFENVTLIEIVDSVNNQIDFSFSYNSSILEGKGKFTISATNEPIDQFLSRLLVGTGIEYSFFKDQIILNYKIIEVVSKRRKQFTITGKVLDEDGALLANASVFLDGTSLGTTSDIDGNFNLSSIPPGYYDLVFSHIGYENAVYSISEFNGGSRIQNHRMQIALNHLEEVEVVSDRITKNQSDWQNNFTVFRKELLGNSENAKDCIIENPEVINFSVDESSDILFAYASDPIQIRNDALGYSIIYYLESFMKSSNDLRYRGQIRFKNSVPIRKSEKREWRRNRIVAYNGSFNHFRNSLLANKLKKEGFEIFDLKRIDQLYNSKKLSLINASDIIVFKGDHYELKFDNYLFVEYRKEKESLDFLVDFNYSSILYKHLISDDGIIKKNPEDQISIIKLLKNSVRLDLNGQIEDRFAITTYGYWSWERLADLVPINYDPKLDNF